MSKEKIKASRHEAVQRLQALAEQIERGTIVVGDRELQVPDHVRLAIKANSKELDIELKWKAPATEAEERSEETATQPAEHTLHPM